ncbi:MAG: hypothetical protein WC759_01790 [Candidatus Micrarchaeia archaeon]
MTVASAVIVFVSLLYVMGGVKNTLEDSSSRIAAVSIGQRVVASVDAMFRDACDVSCTTTVNLPLKIDSFGRSSDYNVTFEGSKVVVDYGKAKVGVESGRPLAALSVVQRTLPGGKTMVIRNSG